MERQTISKWKFFCNFFQVLDYFSIKYSFRLDDQVSYKSYFGGAIFTMYLLFSVVYFGFSFTEFWNGKNYDINYSIVANKDSEVNIQKSKFKFAFSKINDSLLKNSNLRVEYRLFNRTIKPIEFTTCKQEHFSDIMN